MSDVLRSSGEGNGGALWVQRVPGQKPEYIGCADLDDIANPQGDVTLSLCRDANGKFVTVGRGRGAPGAPTTSFTVWIYPEHNILDDILDAGCPIYLYALSKICGRFDDFTGAVRCKILSNFTVTNLTQSNVVKRSDSLEQAWKVDGSGDYPETRTRDVKANRQDIAETTDLRTISFCDETRCEGACGSQHDAGQDGFIGSEAPAGSPGAEADIWNTETGGSAWANATPGAVHPFAAGEDIISSTCFEQSPGVKRHVVARETDPATAAEIAYSDDNDATWNNVVVGAILGECATGPHALFSLNKYHIWFATSEGNVYFSEDGAVTWALLDSATASGGNALNAIHFHDVNNGYAVGDTGTIITTTDGGDTWAAVADPSGGDDFLSVHTFSQYRMICADDAGEIYQTWDSGANFTLQSYPNRAGTDAVNDIQFVNDVCGLMISDTVGVVGRAYKTWNGGYDWEQIAVPANAGFNCIAMIKPNLGYIVGNASGGTGVVLKVS